MTMHHPRIVAVSVVIAALNNGLRRKLDSFLTRNGRLPLSLPVDRRPRMIARSGLTGAFAVMVGSLFVPNVVQAQWYGWDETCRSVGAYQMCATVHIETVAHASGNTRINYQTQWNSTLGEFFWGWGSIFYLDRPSEDVAKYGCANSSFCILLNAWGAQNEWRANSIETIGAWQPTDFSSYYGEFYWINESYPFPASITQKAFGGGGNIRLLALSETPYVVPEPSALLLLATGVVGIAAVGLRRRTRAVGR
jgi:hypothetical protein